MKEANKTYERVYKDYRGVDPDELVQTYREGQEVKYRQAQELYKLIQAAKGAGLTRKEIEKSIGSWSDFLKQCVEIQSSFD